jgi:hypothetical protein
MPPVTIYTVNGETLRLYQWAERLGIRPEAIIYRLQHGWDLESALTTRNTQQRAKRYRYRGKSRTLRSGLSCMACIGVPCGSAFSVA